MNSNFRSRAELSKFKNSTDQNHTKQKLPDKLFSSRINEDINYNDTRYYNSLFFAVHKGELECTHSLLKKFSPHLNIFGRNVIHVAAAKGHEKIICLLSHRGAEISKGDINGNTPLHLAVKGNHIDVVNLLLTKSTVNLQNLKGATPLHIAIQINNFPFVKLLLENGAKVDLQDADGKTPLHISTGIINPNLEIVKTLLTHGNSVHATCKKGFTPLHYVTTSGNVMITEVLIDRGASLSAKDKNKMDPLCLAIKENKTEMVKYILGKKTDFDCIIGEMSPLHFAAQTGNEEIVKMIVTQGDADMINASGEKLKTPLHFSAANGHINVVKYLIESGALIDVEEEGCNTPLHLSAAAGYSKIVSELLNHGAKIDSFNNERFTPLYLAMKNRHKEVVGLLVNMGAHLDGRKIISSNEYVLPAFHIAAKSGDLDILKIFLKRETDVDLKSKHDKTALHFASMFGHTKLVEELVKAGANINSCTKFSETPLHLAAAFGRSETVKYLLNAGANVKSLTNLRYTPLLYALDRQRHYLSSLSRVNISPKKVVISQFCFEKYLKITEMLLIKTPEERIVFALPTIENTERCSPFSYAFKINVTNENQLEHTSNSLEEVNVSKGNHKNTEEGEFRPEIVRCLLNYGVKVNPSMLNEAIKLKHPEVVDILLEYDIKKALDYKSALELAHQQESYDDCFYIILAIAEQVSDTVIAHSLLHQSYVYSFNSKRNVNEEKCRKVLIMILVKMRSSSKTDDVIKSEELKFLEENELLPWYTQCETEVISMREMKIHHQFELTFYQILTIPVRELSNYLRNKDLVRILDSGICRKFEKYAPLLKRNIDRGKDIKSLIDLSTECFLSLNRQNCKIQLPNLVVDKIFQYLSVVDLRKLSATIIKKSHNYKRPLYAHRFREDKRK